MTDGNKKKKLAMIASKGTLDMAYPPLLLATTAAAMDYEVGIFFTFYGLDIINKKKYKKLKVSPIANPAAPMPVPNMLGMLPGMTGMATKMMKSWMNNANVAKLPELLEIAQESGVILFGCQMTMDVMGVKETDLLEGITTCGAANFLDFASDADVTLFI
ncbi:MAG: DsrE/DsrF/DrsH-like family protein [Candidatus Heimdallarchaeota archaeon]|nr:DsrE/DsrF/DrsH-like family protein [Candidatus Heimdallarchaeota archaeon]MDH5645335.1 DsrE/DsrF/DrsH-like family protein [Candidatus Heimdallarchaeota archaeon]